MFWVPGNALRTKTCSDAMFAGSSHAATWPAASKLSGRVVELARVQIRQWGMGEMVQRLTAVLLVLLVRQGRHGVRRIDDEVADGRRLKKSSKATL